MTSTPRILPSIDSSFDSLLPALLLSLSNPLANHSSIVPGSCPVLAFGNPAKSLLATVGLNPSNLEFVDNSGNELDGFARRFHTLGSLGLRTWHDITANELNQLVHSYCDYYCNNPYNAWFGPLDHLISGLGVSYYGPLHDACHLDLVPYATTCKWGALCRSARDDLLGIGGTILGKILRDSAIRVLVLNGSSVVRHFERLANVQLESIRCPQWNLPRSSQTAVFGIGFRGQISKIGGIALDRRVAVFGYNHNIQSSFGVTTSAIAAMRHWLQIEAVEELFETV